MKTEFKTNLRAIWGRAYVRVVGAQREPSWILFEIMMPLLSVATYVFVYKALGAPKDYTGFVILGGIMTAYWLNVLWSMASQFYWEKETGNLELYLIAPISRMSILLGMALGGLFMSTTRAVVILVGGIYLFDVTMIPTSWPLLMLVFLLSMIALYGLGMMASSLFLLFGRDAWQISTLLQEPIYVFSGFFFPVRSLGYAIGTIASLIPLTLGIDAMRQLFFEAGRKAAFLPIGTEILILTVLSVVFLWLANLLLLKMENLGKKEGRLTLRWQ